ncbi:MAG: HAD family phosphatase, partial [Solirubrobacterales bacterium]
PAFVASAAVTNEFMAEIGSERTFEPTELRLASTGMNFRTTADTLARAEGVTVDPHQLERWVVIERQRVTAHLGAALAPDEGVIAALEALAGRFRLAVVSSSASKRVATCLKATSLDRFFPPESLFSAEDSLPEPSGKPDPSIYTHAGRTLGTDEHHAIAIEDSVPGVQAAVGAGYATIGNLVFVPAAERPTREAELLEAGATAVVGSWAEIQLLLEPEPTPVGHSQHA